MAEEGLLEGVKVSNGVLVSDDRASNASMYPKVASTVDPKLGYGIDPKFASGFDANIASTPHNEHLADVRCSDKSKLFQQDA
jgi:hypothetical protein